MSKDLFAGTPERVDGLCDRCFSTHVYKVTISRITDDGVEPWRTIGFCMHCDTRKAEDVLG